jgi:hypothetical protein
MVVVLQDGMLGYARMIEIGVVVAVGMKAGT